jgi:hypothetical protein
MIVLQKIFKKTELMIIYDHTSENSKKQNNHHL